MFTTSPPFSRRHSRISFQMNSSIIRVVIIAINRTDTFVQGLIGTGCVIIGLGIFRERGDSDKNTKYSKDNGH